MFGCDGAVAVALEAADVSPAAAVGDVAELFDVDVDHRTGVFVFVTAGGFAGADIDVAEPTGVFVFVTAGGFAGADIDVAEPIDVATGENGVNSRRGHPEPGADPDRPQPLLPSQVHDLANQLPRGLARTAMRPRGTIVHTLFAHFDVPASPPLRGAPRHPEMGRRRSDRPAVIDDLPGESKALARCQSSVSVGHEDLLGHRVRELDSSTLDREVLTRPSRHTSTNVPGQHS
ncbi:membrane-bound serine protease [Microbacterium testaceum StLB037]|uniref:Membrane-bound serine protease n=1 Tax=Microbacterium testaceum (strain StLB037) TaxID=979556 RepID=E8N8G0_MICTS|nr:membrane-bound serine protease [Microbacterium testaceum StLB037]